MFLRAPRTIVKVNRPYVDIDLDMKMDQNSGDIGVLTNEAAVKNAVKNLILTQRGEVNFHPERGSRIYGLLFENMDYIIAAEIEAEIRQTLQNDEPRISIIGLNVLAKPEQNGFDVTLIFSINKTNDPVTLTLFLERLR